VCDAALIRAASRRSAPAWDDRCVALLVAAVPLATEQYGEYVRQVARWVADRSG